jgi:hypothetical protein
MTAFKRTGQITDTSAADRAAVVRARAALADAQALLDRIAQERDEMSNTPHTPAPWSINDWPQANADIAIGAVGTPLIARVLLRDVSINEQQANAAMIAAAPDLLDALQKIVATEHERHGYHPVWTDQARAAIAKATGGTK